jgi:hypothetical protein
MPQCVVAQAPSGGSGIPQRESAKLPVGAKAIFKPTEADLGSSGRAIVLLYRPENVSTSFRGSVAFRSGPNAGHSAELPAPYEADGVWELTPTSVFGMASKKGKPSVVVLYRALRLGTGEAPVRAGYVYGWSDSQWVIDDPLTEKLVGAATPAAARSRLGR